jgi:hypothetical protein
MDKEFLGHAISMKGMKIAKENLNNNKHFKKPECIKK